MKSTQVAAEVRIDTGSRNMAVNILRAVEPETKSIKSKRSKVHVKTQGTILVLNIAASDTTALRAMVNSYGRWIVSLMKLLPRARR